MKFGIIGLPNVGKSTFFNLFVRKRQARAEDFSFCTIDPNIGLIDYHDTRLEDLAKKEGSNKIEYAKMKIVDIAGLVKGASRGEGLGNKFLSNIREVDFIVHLVRGFNRDTYEYADSSELDNYDTISTELFLADMKQLEKKIIKGKDEIAQYLLDNLEKEIQNHRELEKLEFEQLNGLVDHSQYIEKEQKRIVAFKSYNLLSLKPQLLIVNGTKTPDKLKSMNPQLLDVAELECMVNDLNMQQEADKKIAPLLKKIKGKLNLIDFFTVGPKEARAWTINKGSSAREAAGKIHSDLAKYFVKVELVKSGKIEGPNYIVKDGDVLLFKSSK